MVGDGMGGPIDDEQARLVSSRGRCLRDEMRRERIVEEIGGERRHGG
jgi:hypothetical protein